MSGREKLIAEVTTWQQMAAKEYQNIQYAIEHGYLHYEIKQRQENAARLNAIMRKRFEELHYRHFRNCDLVI